MRSVLLAFEPPDGGVAENVMRLALGLGSHGWAVELAGPEEAAIYPAIERAGIPIRRLPFRPGYAHLPDDLRALRELGRILRTGRYDIIHCHSAKAGVVGRIAARTTRVPSLYSPHSFPFIGDFSTPRRVFATNVERALGRVGNAILCVCDWERRAALDKRVAPPERLHLIRYGSPPCDEAVALDPALMAFGAGGPVAGSVAVLREQKGIGVLIDAAPSVLARVPDARIAIIGNGPLRQEYHERARMLGLDAEERFAFFPFDAPGARYLRTLDVYVLPSLWEALPIGVLEALACGTPQVATDVGGTSEAVDQTTGRLVPPHDARALADAMVELLSGTALRERMAAASRERHVQRFGLDRMVSQTGELYDRIVAGARWSRRDAG